MGRVVKGGEEWVGVAKEGREEEWVGVVKEGR